MIYKQICRWIPIAIFFILVTLVTLGGIQSDKQPLQIRLTQPIPVKDAETHRRGVEFPSGFDAKTYYSPITEYNLFRPLGWRPKRPVERYRILGTLIPTTDDIPPKALIQTTIGNQTYIVTPGQKLDATTEVIDIQSKQVILSENGTHRTLQLPSAF